MNIKSSLGAVALVTACVVGSSAFASTVNTINTISNVVFIVDESGSMAGEQAFLQSTVTQLDSALDTAGVTNRSYGVVGFGGGGAGNEGRIVGAGANLTDAATAATNLSNLGTGGFAEDGYAGIDFALNNLNFTQGAAINFILVTDEDRDLSLPQFTSTGITNALTNANILLNAVVNATFTNGSNSALGIDSNGDAYVADGGGGFTTTPGGVNTGGTGDTETEYVDVALATGGAAWNLNFIDGGGTNLTSFTQAFIDIKVQEITSQPPSGPPNPAPIPLPAAGWMLLAGLGGLVAMRRRQSA